MEVWAAQGFGPPLQSDGPVVELSKALSRLGWDLAPEGAYITDTGETLSWEGEVGKIQHALRDRLRATAVEEVDARRETMKGVGDGLHRGLTLALAGTLEDYPQDRAMIRYVHCALRGNPMGQGRRCLCLPTLPQMYSVRG